MNMIGMRLWSYYNDSKQKIASFPQSPGHTHVYICTAIYLIYSYLTIGKITVSKATKEDLEKVT